jgi:hypothetical protein
MLSLSLLYAPNLYKTPGGAEINPLPVLTSVPQKSRNGCVTYVQFTKGPSPPVSFAENSSILFA